MKARAKMRKAARGAGPRRTALQCTVQRALATSEGRMRVQLERLGPAVFNRQGNPTCGKHCQTLMKRILEEEGFATFRYDAGYCHEPDPPRSADGCEPWRLHG